MTIDGSFQGEIRYQLIKGSLRGLGKEQWPRSMDLKSTLLKHTEYGPVLKKVDFQHYREYYVVVSLNLCLGMPSSLQMELAQSDHGGSKNSCELFCTFLAFSRPSVVLLS